MNANPKPHEVTQAGDRSVVALIHNTIRISQQQYGAIPPVICIDGGDAHLLAKELKAGGQFIGESRGKVEAKIKEGKLAMFGGQVLIRVAS